MNDRQKTLENAFGSIEKFVKSGHDYIVKALGVYHHALEDLKSEYCAAGLDAAGRIDSEKTDKEVKAFISTRARGAVVDYIRKVTQNRVAIKTEVLSLDAETDEICLYDEIASNRFDTPETAALKREEKSLFTAALETLPASHREVLQATIEGKTMVEIAADRGVSKQAISKIHAAAVENMKLAVA